MFQFQEVNSEYTYWEKKADFSPWHEQVDSLLHPVTALAFVPLKQNSRPLLFAGEGPFLRIYCHDRLSCLVSERIFDSQSIHGITDLTIPSGPHGKESNTLVLLWGGNSVCLLVVDLFSSQTQPGFKIKRISSIIQTDDWILDASFRPEADNDGNFERDLFYVVLINGHNCLQYLRIQALSYPEYKYELHLCHFIEGPKSILYSAHIGWSSIGRGLVAAGTVLGEVILWSFHSDDITSDSNFPFSCFVHYIFHGHEGSVFGVRISDQPKNSLSIPAGRCLASCSDDRTIRVWDISSADDELDPNILDQSVGDDTHSYRSHEVSCLPLATTMGHSSRIWGLRFLRHTREGSLLLSFGEDATSQIWHLRTQSNFIDSGQIGQPWDDHLQHECVFEFHAKRNIWSATAYRDLDGNFTVSTGGADGRIVCFSLNDDREGLLIAGTSRTAEWTVSNVLDKLSYDDEKNSFEEIIAAKAGVKIMPENVFATFNGQWNVNRRLESGLSTYQSGNFKGMASFEMRSPTDPAYDAEYLYIENGEFCSDQGLVIPATRRYVYRFQRNDNAISAWFVKTEDGLTVDYLFHHVNFPPCNQESFLGTNEMRRRLLKANGQHLCVDDDYKANYLFRFQGLLCNDWELKYMVNGPRKAYSATTQYVRDGLRQIANSDLMSESVLKTMSKSGQQDEVEDGKRVPSKGAFNNYSLVGKDQLLALTTQGYLLQGKIYCSGTQRDGTARNQIKPECLWVKIDQLEDFESSCLVSSIQHPAITIIAGKRGNMYFYQHHQEFLMKSQIQLPEKATYLKAHIFDRCKIPDQNLRKVKLLVISSCLRPLIGYAFHLDVDLEISSYSMSSSFALTLRPHFIVTSSCFAKMEGILFLGSRNGALAIYEYRTSSTVHANLTPSFVSHGINGRDAITVIENLPLKNSTSDTEAYILTAGRDGTYSIHLITTERRRSQVTSFGFQTVHTCKLPFGRNIEGACFNRTTEELWLWGFSSKDFVVWNESRKAKVITVECGGAHRNWAFLPGDDVDAGGQLAWTKASSCRIYSQPQASHQVLQPGGHGREIKAAAVSPPIKLLGGQFAKFVATGAEDTAIRIFLAPEIENDGTQLAPQGVQCLGIFTKHTSGLQQLRWSPNGQFLFSAAACEEFFVWHVRPAPCFKIGLTCEAICPSATEAADLRIMCFDVMEMGSHENETNGASLIHRYLLSMVYSDSTVRVYLYESASTKPEFHLISTGTYMTFCLTKALCLPFHSSIHLCTASTDGHISFWSLSTLLAENGILTRTREPRIAYSNSSDNQMSAPSSRHATDLSWHSRIKIHQSSINAMCSLYLSPSTFIVVTGGDDGALGFTRVTNSNNTELFPHHQKPPLSCSTLLIPNAHAATITAITYLSSRVCSSFTNKNKNRRGIGDPQTQLHSFVTTGPDQKLQIWLVSFNRAKPGVEGLRVEKGTCVNTAVADAACLERFVYGLESDGGREESYNHDDDQDDETENENKNKGNKSNTAGTPNLTRPGKNRFKSEPDPESDFDEENQDPITVIPIPTHEILKKEHPLRILVAGIGLEIRKLKWIPRKS